MGTSYVSFQDRCEAFNDSDLLMVLRLASNSMGQRGVLAELANAWEEAIRNHAPGVVDVPLGNLAEQSTERGQLAALLLELETEVSNFGDFVPLPYLREHCNMRGIRYLAGYPTSRIVAAIKRLRDLLEA